MGKTRRQLMILTGRRPTLKRNVKKADKKMVMGKSISASATNIVPTFLHMLNTVKLYHWRTTDYSTHKATDKLYGALNEKIDQFVEVMLGKNEMGGRAKLLNATNLKIDIFSHNDAFKKQIEIYKQFLLNLSNDPTFNSLPNTDLLAIRDEILADMNQFLYLLGATPGGKPH